MRAGSGRGLGALARWVAAGDPQLKLQANSPLAKDIDQLENWLQTDLWLSSFALPTQLGDFRSPPRRGGEILKVIEVFRRHALPRFGREWINSFPRIPSAETEEEELPENQQRYDEHMAPRRLGGLDSASAEISLRLELTRGVAAAALSRFRMRRTDQVNPHSIFCGARLKYYYKGTPLPTWRPSTFRWVRRGSTESLNSHLTRYSLHRHLAELPDLDSSYR